MRGDLEESIKILQSALQMEPSMIEIHVLLAAFCLIGICRCRVAAAQSPQHRSPLHRNTDVPGKSLPAEGRYKACIKKYREAAKYDPILPSFASISESLFQSGQYQRALMEAKRVLEIDSFA